MGKKIWCIILAVAFATVIVLIAWDGFLWRSFGFKFCENPKYLRADIEVDDCRCNIILADICLGSFSSTSYNGIIYEFADGVLKIGVHKSRALNAITEISEEITVDGTITEVRICG